MSKKVAFITEEYSETDFSSGGIKLNYELISELVKQDYVVDIYSKKYFKNNNIANKYFNFSELAEYSKLKEKYDIVISEKGIYPSDITYIHDHSYKYRFPLMYKSKLIQFLYKFFMFKKHIKRVEKDKIIKYNLDKTSKIVVSSSILKQDMMQNFNQEEEKIFILPPALNQNPKAEFKQKGDFTIFGLVAVGLSRKGCYEVLNAVKKLKKEYKYFLVKIIYPKYRSNLWLQLYLKFNNLDKYVKFLPLHKNMNSFYDTIDFMLMPSKVEPFGMVAIEAMSNYKPTLATNICGACDVIDDEKLICSSNNLKEYMENLINITNDEYEVMAKSAYQKVSDMNWANFSKNYLEILGK